MLNSGVSRGNVGTRPKKEREDVSEKEWLNKVDCSNYRIDAKKMGNFGGCQFVCVNGSLTLAQPQRV